MTTRSDTLLDKTRTRLAHALGFDEYPTNPAAEPYITYIIKTYDGNDTEDFIELFIAVITHFKTSPLAGTNNTIQLLLDSLALTGFRKMFMDTTAGEAMRRHHVEDVLRCRSRKVFAAHSMVSNTVPQKTPWEEDIRGLVLGRGHGASLYQGLLGQAMGQQQGATNTHALPYQFLDDADISESLSIKTFRLNASKLHLLAAVDILWTPNISRHMLLNKLRGRFVLELFALPCAFAAVTTHEVGISAELTLEIEESYAMLFNAEAGVSKHAEVGAVIGLRHWCWCASCSAYRYREKCIDLCKVAAGADPRSKRRAGTDGVRSHLDPLLAKLMAQPAIKEWTPDDFPHLWTRIRRLDQHLQTARPWSIWVLFRDRRDTVQFWTFLFATIVVFLTVVQVLLGVAQVVGSFI
ncbi:hypothetical protein OPT61_g9004 [Boeremia exigua]|uniref:Uncharacterized protein n=1 Tax=Boeremia exigua TaxID=749465 RepID=A0ACC2HWH8_9PLEO|nr:hypothetical protein OPT61_g9004 [Boeremia exigua]